ncbi:hypothetical protein BF49_3759 [Bradyrhizobium sp.]|nr:hypothetical protein BF49_3759 [Bradyrhizobium sp.]
MPECAFLRRLHLPVSLSAEVVNLAQHALKQGLSRGGG